MLWKKTRFMLPALLYSFLCVQANEHVGKIKWVISNQCSLQVNGSTNINTFSCIVPNYTTPDTLICTKAKELPVALLGKLNITVADFDCHNKMMTADLRKTLKANQFQACSIQFLTLNKFPELKTSKENIAGFVNITLAGVSKRFEVQYQVWMDEGKTIHIVGTRMVRFSDFNLTPPRKLGGMIQAKDALDVLFQLNLKQIE